MTLFEIESRGFRPKVAKNRCSSKKLGKKGFGGGGLTVAAWWPPSVRSSVAYPHPQ